MESYIKVKANREEMADIFDNATLYSIRYYNEIRKGLFDVRVRHKELSEHLKGTYTIAQLNKVLS